jgi:hypothetical protein
MRCWIARNVLVHSGNQGAGRRLLRSALGARQELRHRTAGNYLVLLGASFVGCLPFALRFFARTIARRFISFDRSSEVIRAQADWPPFWPSD